MSTALLSIQKDIYDSLRINSNLKDLNASVYDYVPVKEDFPYIVIADGTENPENTFNKKGKEVTFRIHIWSRYNGFRECYKIEEEIKKELDFTDISINDYDLIYIKQEDSNSIKDPDGVTRQLVLNYRIIVREN